MKIVPNHDWPASASGRDRGFTMPRSDRVTATLSSFSTDGPTHGSPSVEFCRFCLQVFVPSHLINAASAIRNVRIPDMP